MNKILKFSLIFFLFSCNSSDEESSSLKCSNALKNKDYDVGIEVCKKISKANAEFQQLLTECKLKNYDQN